MTRPAVRRAALLGLVACAAAVPGAAAAPPTGDGRGLALLARVHRAYVRVPALAMTGKTGSLSFRFTVVLSSGIVVGEQFVGATPSGTTMLVGRRGSPTFAREPGASCWNKLAASDRQSFENLGLPFPDEPRMRVYAPRRTSTGWELPAVVDRDPGTFVVDGTSLRIREIVLLAQGTRIVEHVRALLATPRLVAPTPRC